MNVQRLNDEEMGEVLKFVNEVRAHEKINLPPISELRKGEARSCGYCSISLSVCNNHKYQVVTDTTCVRVWPEHATRHRCNLIATFTLPDAVKKFINAFDSGLYPELLYVTL